MVESEQSELNSEKAWEWAYMVPVYLQRKVGAKLQSTSMLRARCQISRWLNADSNRWKCDPVCDVTNNQQIIHIRLSRGSIILTTLGYDTIYTSEMFPIIWGVSLQSVHEVLYTKFSHDVSLCVTADRKFFSMTLCITGTLHSRNTQVLRATMAVW